MAIDQIAVSRDLRADLATIIEAMPAAQMIGLKVVGFGAEGTSRIETLIQAALTFDGLTVQGGVIGMLADFAGVSAAAASYPTGWMASTTGFEVHNLAPARGERIVALGQCISAQKSHAVSRADVYCIAGATITHVATALTTCRPFQLRV